MKHFLLLFITAISLCSCGATDTKPVEIELGKKPILSFYTPKLHIKAPYIDVDSLILTQNIDLNLEVNDSTRIIRKNASIVTRYVTYQDSSYKKVFILPQEFVINSHIIDTCGAMWIKGDFIQEGKAHISELVFLTKSINNDKNVIVNEEKKSITYQERYKFTKIFAGIIMVIILLIIIVLIISVIAIQLNRLARLIKIKKQKKSVDAAPFLFVIIMIIIAIWIVISKFMSWWLQTPDYLNI